MDVLHKGLRVVSLPNNLTALMAKCINKLSYNPHSSAAQPAAETQQHSHGQPLHNSSTVPVLQVNLLPVCEDEVHLIVHTNGPHKAFSK